MTFRDWQKQAMHLGTEKGRDALRTLREWPQDEWPMPEPGKNPRKVAIVGKGSYDCLAPWGAPGWELWGLNDAAVGAGWAPIKAHTRWFQLHNPAYMAKHYPKGNVELDYSWPEPNGVRLYMDRHYKRYPDSEPFPKEDVEALSQFGRYHASSFDWMVGLAIAEEFDTIALHGCEFGMFPYTYGEPISGRPCLEFWVGLAAGRGIEIEVGPQNTGELFQIVHHASMRSTLQYGFDNEPALDLEGWRDVR